MSITSEIFQNELLHLREDGMSNAEIAKSLDISYATVLRLIGKQPSGMRRPSPNTGFVTPVPKPACKEEELEACLLVASREIQLSGDFGEYVLNSGNQTVSIAAGEGSLSVPFGQIDVLINELSAIKRNISDVVRGNEMW